MQTFDKLEHLDSALIQHGPLNDRVYLMKLGKARPEALVDSLLRKAVDGGYSKIFVKIPASADEPFLNAGFQREASVPGFFNGKETASFLGYYLDTDRKREKNPGRLDEILDLAIQQRNAQRASPPSLSEREFTLRRCQMNDVKRMAEIYRNVFPTYPFPIQNPLYLNETMKSHVAYFGVTESNRLIALSASEMDTASKNAEMTDFATLPLWRGKSFGKRLLSFMEQAMKTESIKTAYTIARAASPGINITFARCNYKYGGRLINNTNISGQIESMNIWYKSL